MKGIAVALTSIALVSFAGFVLADDQGNLSKALETGKDVYCNSIRDSDLKNYCQGLVKKQDVYCNNIHDSKLKKECKAKTK